MRATVELDGLIYTREPIQAADRESRVYLTDQFERAREISDQQMRRIHRAAHSEGLMSTMTMKEMSKAMAKIDFAMLTTRTECGQLATRPMSNNGEVEYDGDSFYFSWESARTVNDIDRDPQVALSFQGSAGLLGQPPLFIAVEGTARIVRDKGAFADHWSSDLERWFPKGIDTEGMVMIHVHADRIHYWDGNDEGEISI